jgi:hypothetical protein
VAVTQSVQFACGLKVKEFVSVFALTKMTYGNRDSPMHPNRVCMKKLEKNQNQESCIFKVSILGATNVKKFHPHKTSVVNNP